MWKQIRDREEGKIRPESFAHRFKSNRIAQLQLSNYKDIVSPHKGSLNSLQVVMNFKMPGKVYRTAMSPLASSHMLIAAGTEDVQVRLCDIASGAFAHTLSGHRGM